MPSTIKGTPSASYSLTIRLKIRRGGVGLHTVLETIATAGGDTDGIDKPGSDNEFVTRDITVLLRNSEHGEEVVRLLTALPDVEVQHVSDRTFLMHLGGKIDIVPRREVKTRDDLSMIYTPGVARVCKAIAADPSKASSLTMKGNMVAVISDGSRVLSLGDIGPLAGLPVMEGKAVLFKRFGGVNAFPLVIDAHDPEEIIKVIKAVAPGFSAINLEDIASPGCYIIEDRLRDELDIPVFHDDQHATAIVVLAATINAAKLTRKQLRNLKVVVSGVGAAGMACCKLLLAAGVRNLIGYNIGGAIHKGRSGLTAQEQWLAEHSNPKQFTGSMQEALKGADMFLGLSVAGVIKAEDLAVMRRDPIVFALANPDPEVSPLEAKPYVRVMATGGSDYPNQINNALVFPGIFAGAIEARVPNITDEMKMEAARALAAVITADEREEDYIIPSVFDPRAHKAVAEAVIRVAQRTGQARRIRTSTKS